MMKYWAEWVAAEAKAEAAWEATEKAWEAVKTTKTIKTIEKAKAAKATWEATKVLVKKTREAAKVWAIEEFRTRNANHVEKT